MDSFERFFQVKTMKLADEKNLGKEESEEWKITGCTE